MSERCILNTKLSIFLFLSCIPCCKIYIQIHSQSRQNVKQFNSSHYSLLNQQTHLQNVPNHANILEKVLMNVKAYTIDVEQTLDRLYCNDIYYSEQLSILQEKFIRFGLFFASTLSGNTNVMCSLYFRGCFYITLN